jgi:hypothetical protein
MQCQASTSTGVSAVAPAFASLAVDERVSG